MSNLMDRDPIETGTWRWERMLVTWTFRSRRPARELVALAVESLDDFAVATKVEVATASQGEAAVVREFGSPPSARDLATVLDQHDDVTTVDVELALLCIRPDGTSARLGDGGLLFFEPDGSEMRMSFSINVDLFAPRTWGANRDNQQLASLNGPRLNDFLSRLRERTGAELADLDFPVDDYGDMFTPQGVSVSHAPGVV